MSSRNVSWKNQLILAAGLFVVGSAAIWLEYKHKPQQEARDEQSKKVFATKDLQISAIELVDGPKRVRLTCDVGTKLCKPGDNARWSLELPLKAKADDANVSTLVSALGNLSVPETIDLKDETPEKRQALLKEYGLDEASRKGPTHREVDVTTPDGASVLYLGLTHPIGEGIFGVASRGGKLDDSRVYIVPSYFKGNFDHDFAYWRDKRLVSMPVTDVRSFELKGPRGTAAGEKKDGGWILHAPPGEIPGDPENIDGFLSAATLLNAKGFAADQKDGVAARATLQGTKSVLTLALKRDGAADPVTLTFFEKKNPKAAPAPGKPATLLYATVSGADALFELDPTAKDRLDKTVQDFRLAKLITSLERFSAKRIELSGAGWGKADAAPTVLKNANGQWTLDGQAAALPSDKVQAMLEKLSGNRIQDFISASDAAAKAPGEDSGLHITFADEAGQPKRKLVFWRAGPIFLYARDLQSKRKEIWRVDPTIGASLPWDRAFFAAKPTPAVSPAPAAGAAK